jgi:hypothetical protein
LFEFCKYHGWHVTSGAGVGEVTSANDVVEAARRLVIQRIDEQARKVSSEFVVGSEIKIDVREVPCGYQGCQRDDLDVNISWLGTGIRRIPNWRPSTVDVPPFMLSMTPVGKRRDNRIDEDDDASEIERAAEEAEENALEASEYYEADNE